jgi:hypothetical protein
MGSFHPLDMGECSHNWHLLRSCDEVPSTVGFHVYVSRSIRHDVYNLNEYASAVQNKYTT